MGNSESSTSVGIHLDSDSLTDWSTKLKTNLIRLTEHKLDQIRGECYGRRERALNSLLYADLNAQVASLFEAGADPRQWCNKNESLFIKLIREEHFLGNFDRKFGNCPTFKPTDARIATEHPHYSGKRRCTPLYALLNLLVANGVSFRPRFNVICSALHEICYESEDVKGLLFNILLWSYLAKRQLSVTELKYLCPMNVDHRYMAEVNIHCVYHIDQQQECRPAQPEEFERMRNLSHEVPKLQALALHKVRQVVCGPHMQRRIDTMVRQSYLPRSIAHDVSYVSWSRAGIYAPELSECIQRLFSVDTVVRLPRTFDFHDQSL